MPSHLDSTIWSCRLWHCCHRYRQWCNTVTVVVFWLVIHATSVHRLHDWFHSALNWADLHTIAGSQICAWELDIHIVDMCWLCRPSYCWGSYHNVWSLMLCKFVCVVMCTSLSSGCTCSQWTLRWVDGTVKVKPSFGIFAAWSLRLWYSSASFVIGRCLATLWGV